MRLGLLTALFTLAACNDQGFKATPVCGDGSVDSDEECDDGNGADGDGCAADC